MSESISLHSSGKEEALPVARDWIMMNYDELHSRARACIARRYTLERDEAVAEALAIVYASVARAAQRGTLSQLTVYWAVVFAVRQVRAGRRSTNSSSKCVMDVQTQRRGRAHVVSLETLRPKTDGDDERGELALSDRDGADPGEIVRRELDFAMMLRNCRRNVRVTFNFLAATHGSGRMADLADGRRRSSTG